MSLADIAADAEAAGLALRGAFRLSDEERAGALAQARSVVLLGFVGATQWPSFAASPEAADGRPHPLDRWSRRIISALAGRFAATPLFPFDGPPYWPFQAWAQRAEAVFASPLGVLIHPLYGLSHSYRGALALGQDLAPPQPAAAAASPCETCANKPCLAACPVGAFTPSGYAVEDCTDWLRLSGADCRDGGCLARRACPVGREFAQRPDQARFHMAAFLAARP